jgi:SAM-dependent methyltransferase
MSVVLLPGARRTECSVCGRGLNGDDGGPPVPVPCHVRAFFGEQFHVRRCTGCRTIHCVEAVDLDLYYAKYPMAAARLTWPFKVFYTELLARLSRFGFSRARTLLDYGCGRGVFLRYLKRLGYRGGFGYDPYGRKDEYGDPAVLSHGPFEFILLQDVVEHVEDADELLRRMDALLAPGGHILVGTPNADNIDLSRPAEFLNQLHAPYHLHIFGRSTLEQLGRKAGWDPVGFFDHAYHDRPFPTLNNRAADEYRRQSGGAFDTLVEKIKAGPAFLSPKFWALSFVGYWLSRRADMQVMFRKRKG